jgi:MFS family permease
VTTALVAWQGDRLGARRTLLAATLLGGLGLVLLAGASSLEGAVAAAAIGMLNGMGRDRGPASTLEQSVLAGADPGRRTALFVRYALVQDAGAALGAAAAVLPGGLDARLGADEPLGYRLLLLGLGTMTLAGAFLYLALPPDPPRGRGRPVKRVSAPTRRRVAGLSALFALDSLGGGLLAGAILAYWFFERFGIGAGAIGGVFVAARVLNALSYLAAEHLARRIGLVRTMVFTHLPSSALLALLPLVPTATLAIGLFLLREALVQMDVPARQSYVAAIVGLDERTYALGATSLARYTGWAAGPALAGAAIGALGLGAPLFAGAALKAGYDLLLLAGYRSLRPPEERGGAGRVMAT